MNKGILEMNKEIVERVGLETLNQIVRETGENAQGMLWAYVEDSNKDYAISTTGLALTFKSERNIRLLTKSPNSAGYSQYTLSLPKGRKQALAHRMVAEAFITNERPEVATLINHIDGNKSNNSIHNLEWVTHQENSRHAIETGLNPTRKGVKNKTSKSIDRKPNHLRYGTARVYVVTEVESGKVYELVGSRDVEVVVKATLSNIKSALTSGKPHNGFLIKDVGSVSEYYKEQRKLAGYTYNVEVR